MSVKQLLVCEHAPFAVFPAGQGHVCDLVCYCEAEAGVLQPESSDFAVVGSGLSNGKVRFSRKRRAGGQFQFAPLRVCCAIFVHDGEDVFEDGCN